MSRAILISADGGLRWYDVPYSASPRRFSVMVYSPLSILETAKQLDPRNPVNVERRDYEQVGSGDGFDVYREVL